MSIRENIVNKAKEYLGYTEGPDNDTMFGDWSGSPKQPWCASFVSYVLRNAGVSKEITPLFVSCTKGFNKFVEMGRATREHIMPNVGDIIFFVWKKGESTPDHVGLVEKVEDSVVHTIEGNRSDKVQRFEYDLNSWQIYGYATPNYAENNAENSTESVEKVETEKVDTVIKKVTVKVNSVLRIREGASTATNKVGEYHNNDKVDIYEIVGNWGRSNKGWICLDYTEEYKVQSANSGYVLGLYQVNTPSGLNVRKKPVNGDKIKAYPNGTRFDTYELQGNWAKTPSGWVCLDYCKLIRTY